MGRRKRRSPLKLDLKPETLYSIVAILFMILGVLVMVSFTGQGKILQAINAFLRIKLGVSIIFLPFVCIASGLMLLQSKWAWSKPHVLLGSLLIMFGWLGFFRTGEVGAATFHNTSELFTVIGATSMFFGIIVAGALVVGQFSLTDVLEKLGEWRERLIEKKMNQSELDDVFATGDDTQNRFSLPKISLGFLKPKRNFASTTHGKEDDKVTDSGDGSELPKLPLSAQHARVVPKKLVLASHKPLSPGMSAHQAPLIWEYPPLSLLSNSEGGTANRGDINKNADIIEETLKSFGIRAKVADVSKGPAVTRYALEITQGTKLSKITSLATDLALALAAPTGQIRIEAPIAGKSLVGIEVPNHSSQYVTLRKLLKSPILAQNPSKLAVALGLDVSGEPIITDIAKMPHVLIAGSTGSGKSVCVNTFMCSILFRASPDEVKFILVDPKRVELTGYNDIPHLLTPVIVEPKKVVSALKWATDEMESRYKKLAEVGVKNIAGYNELAGHAVMPSIVIVIDELADVMLFAPKEVEECVTRIAQMARAVGIHLVLATQRPSVDVLTGLIKANVPTRIAFNVSSMTDSRVILDSPGAEKLLGRGDMLYLPADKPKPVRVQGTFVDDQEIRKLIEFIKNQGHRPQYEEEITTKYKVSGNGYKNDGSGAGDVDGRDEMFEEVASFLSGSDKASSSMLQRRFSIGYNRAAKIIDQLHAAGMVGPINGSKPREVYVTKILQFLQNPSSEQTVAE